MRTATLGPLGEVSRLTLGGGIGQIWGETTHEEALATLHAAVDAGITVIDAAPMYRNAESFIGDAFGGRPPPGVRFTTKCQLGTPGPGQAANALASSLDASLAAMRLSRVDVFFLHSNIHPTASITLTAMRAGTASRPAGRPMRARSSRPWSG